MKVILRASSEGNRAERRDPVLTDAVGQPSTREDGFLLALGKRVRELRSRRGMTRKIVARDSEVSERHLAQLEAGEGNISVVLLRRIAAALHVNIADLFVSDVEQPAGKRIIERFLERLPAHRVEDVVSHLMGEFADDEKARRRRIALVGLRGAGKSTLGSKLAQALQMPFLELDHEIEKAAGMALGDIFSLYGQAGYRAFEKRTLERTVAEHERATISVGGGIVSEKDTYDYLLSHCYTIWIKAQPEEHMSRVMAQGDFRVIGGSSQAMEDLRRIMAAREPLYRRADLLLDTSGDSVEESFAKLKLAAEQNLQ